MKKMFNLISIVSVAMLASFCDNPKDAFYVEDNRLLDPCGKEFVIRGVNKMAHITPGEGGYAYVDEIAKTGANCVRFEWLPQKRDEVSLKALEDLIAKCLHERMVPMITLSDAHVRLDWNTLPELIDFWKTPEVIEIVKRYQNGILINIGDAVGDSTVTPDQFRDGYADAVNQLRTAGIHVPLIIDATGYGANLGIIVQEGQNLINSDPDKNMMFSVHPYWSIKSGATPVYIEAQIQEALKKNLPLVIGELPNYGGWAGPGVNPCDTDGEINWRAIADIGQKYRIGWLAWEWGPGNGFDDPVCLNRDMSNGKFSGLTPHWGLPVAVTDKNSIKNTAQRSYFIDTYRKKCK